MDRRKFIKTAAAASVATSLSDKVALGSDSSSSGTLPFRTLGRSGEKVSMVGLGGYHIGQPKDEQLSIRIVRTALDNGINFLDNCWDYNGGQSEIRMGKALLDGYRKKAFLMTKIDGQTKQAATQQLEESLRRLQTDHIDLLQFHEVIRETDPARILGPGGGMEAVLEAKKQGKVRYIGFTGHKSPDIHLKMLETAFAHQFTFDAVQMPLNVMDAHYNSFEKKVLPVLVKHGIGVLGMKPMGDANHPQQQDSDAGGMSALCHEPADQRGDHRMRVNEYFAAGNRCGTLFQANDLGRSLSVAGEDSIIRGQG